MPRLQINGEPIGLEPRPLRWDELLQTIDETSQARGHIVTAVRFNGVEESTFRRPDLCNRLVSDTDAIEVTTASRRRCSAMHSGARRLRPSALASTAADVARALRIGNRRHAADQIAATRPQPQRPAGPRRPGGGTPARMRSPRAVGPDVTVTSTAWSSTTSRWCRRSRRAIGAPPPTFSSRSCSAALRRRRGLLRGSASTSRAAIARRRRGALRRRRLRVRR